MPKNLGIRKTATQYRDEIIEHYEAIGDPISKSRAMKLAIKMHRKRDQIRNFEHGLRILGIYTDATPRTALRNVEEAKA
jgi:hypothetical protein